MIKAVEHQLEMEQEQEMEQIIMVMKEKNIAILDVEFIQSSKYHKCVRKFYILANDGYTDMELDFRPCKPLSELSKAHQRSFRFCQHHIHKLSYYPSQKYAPRCAKVLEMINTFIVYNGIDAILFKGGTIKKELCHKLCIPSYNLECLQDIQKVDLHDPRTEVNGYYDQLVNLDYL